MCECKGEDFVLDALRHQGLPFDHAAVARNLVCRARSR